MFSKRKRGGPDIITYEEFMARLRRLKRKWRLEPVNGCRWIVSKTGKHSPLTAVASVATLRSYRRRRGHHRNPLYQGHAAAKDLNMSEDLCRRIESAITEDPRFFDPQIRRDLLDACRLQEPPKKRGITRKERLS